MKETIKKSIIGWIAFLSTVIIGGMLYAAIGSTWINPATLEVGAGSGLTATSWNWLLANFNNLDARVTSAGTPAGAVQYFAMQTCPTGWTEANGGTISRTTYSTLFTAIGTTFGVGDGSTTFKLPDLRGEFIRGLDGGRGIDTGRVLGTAQGGAIQSHTHTNAVDRGSPTGAGFSSFITGTPAPNSSPGNQDSGYTGGSETRPRNIALLSCIKY